jgi:hypothetical protein
MYAAHVTYISTIHYKIIGRLKFPISPLYRDTPEQQILTICQALRTYRALEVLTALIYVKCNKVHSVLLHSAEGFIRY